MASSTSDRVIGIMGGMGPEATVELMRQIIRRTPAHDDADHVRMLVDNNPKVPSRLAFLLEGGKVDPTSTLVDMALGLEKSGASLICIACNTAHAFAPAIREAIRIPFIDMIDSALQDVRNICIKPIPGSKIRFAVLGSPALRRIGIFDKKCQGTDLEPLYSSPVDEELALSVIRAVKSGDLSQSVIDRYLAVKRNLREAGTDVVLVCCTEFSVLEEKLSDRDPKTLDSMTSLVDRLL